MKTRITGPANSCYHVFSRIIEKRFYLGCAEKNAFCALLRRAAYFSGVNVLTYCVMDNHFHILVQIPERIDIDDEQLLCRLKTLYGTGPRMGPYDPVNEFLQSENEPVLREKLRKKYLRRMYDLSEFMRTLKIRFSFWFNRHHQREGTLWDSRFKSVLVQGAKYKKDQNTGNLALVTMAAYIDLNAVRAGIVESPSDYQWCGYAQAIQGDYFMKYGIASIYDSSLCDPDEWAETIQSYYSMLFQHCSLSHREKAVDLHRSRVRYFTRGGVLGCRSFVDEVFAKHRWMFSSKRQSGSRKMRGGDWGELCAIRDVGV